MECKYCGELRKYVRSSKSDVELSEKLKNYAAGYKKIGIFDSSIVKEEDVKAVIIDFFNYVGLEGGIDFSSYASDGEQ